MSTAQRDSPLSSGRLFGSLWLDFKAACLEFVGTTFFLLLGFGGIQAATGEALVSGTDIEHVLYISTCMGFSLLVSAWLFFRVTGGLFNPNITLALFLVGVVNPVRFVLFCIAQLVGAIAASALVHGLTPGPLSVNTFLQQGVSPAQGVFIEMFITAALVISVLMLAAEKHSATPFAPVGIGLTLFVGHLWAVFYTGACMNTARSFGPAVVTGFGYPLHWVYWVGPLLGSLLGAAFYAILKLINYRELNPAQASTRPEDSPQAPVTLGMTDGHDEGGIASGSKGPESASDSKGERPNESKV
ncbi:aquaporin-like protein [Phlebopus sp. FC_14]|nr:aquaporin-like protein [Phlebopus sp. FC_14]